ncbi:MAG: prepilin-type N-terminal cleavage/methylation domain-containing protein [Gemmatimonadaceae bacterium]|nr:prepilin-type N-terminal cleavage/methylation domain-containing protein [Gemmatimonadaceae bacterium]
MRATSLQITQRRRDQHRGFTLVEVVLALTLLSGVVLMLSMGTTKFQRSVGDSNIRSRAQARADLQLAMARSWPTWSTLESLTGGGYNGVVDGLTTVTAVSADTTAGKRIKRITVTVSASTMPVPVKRTIAVAAP